MHKLKGILQIALYFFSTVGLILLSNKIERLSPEFRSIIAAFLGVTFGFLFFKIIQFIFQKLNVPTISFSRDSLVDLVKGSTWGIIAFFSSVYILYFLGHSTDLSQLKANSVFNQVSFQFRPAILEEVGFRFGIVSVGLHYFGRNTALILGAVPFGVSHLLNFLTGDPIYWEYILGTSIAGLFLTAAYFAYGVLGAISAHYTWNVLASLSSKASSFKQQELEAGFGTYFVLVILTIYLLYKVRKKQ